MFSLKLSTIINISFILLCIICISCFYIETCYIRHQRDKAYQEISKLNVEVATQNEAITTWKKEADNLQKKIEMAEVQARKEMDSDIDKYNKSLNENTGNDCPSAIKWAALRAQEMYK